MSELNEYCAKQLRDQNYDRYLACLYLPENIRNLGVALYAFDAEIARIPNLVSDPMTGEIRLQWWRDTISQGIGAGLTHNPMADCLLGELAKHQLPIQPLDDYLQARILDLYHDPMPDQGTLEGYCGETTSVFFLLLAMSAGVEQNRQLADICGHAGMALALTDILRSVARHTTQSRRYLPKAMLDSAEISEDHWFATDPTDAHLAVILSAVVQTETHLAQLSECLFEYKSKNLLMPILLPTGLCKAYLAKIKKQGRGIFLRPPNILPLMKHWHLWRAAH